MKDELILVKSEKKPSKVIVQSKSGYGGRFKNSKVVCRFWSYFLRYFIYQKMSKNVEIVFSIPKAKSGSISVKIRQPFLWTDPCLPGLLLTAEGRHLGFLWPLPNIHTSHQCLEDLHWFKAIFKTFGQAVFEAIEVKGVRCWILRLQPRNFVIISESLAANLEKVRQASVCRGEYNV